MDPCEYYNRVIFFSCVRQVFGTSVLTDHIQSVRQLGGLVGVSNLRNKWLQDQGGYQLIMVKFSINIWESS
jgi:hypothetical protein